MTSNFFSRERPPLAGDTSRSDALMDSSRKLHHEAQQRVAIITFSETASQRGGRDTKRSMPVRGGNAERALGGKQKEEKNQARFQESETDEW